MLSEAHWALLQEAADRPHVQCRLFGNLYGHAGAIDWNGTERHRLCQELAAEGYLIAAGLAGSRQHEGGQWSRWLITGSGRAALRVRDADAASEDGDSRPKPGPP